MGMSKEEVLKFSRCLELAIKNLSESNENCFENIDAAKGDEKQ